MGLQLRFNHGDRVIVIDSRGNHEARGVVLGRHASRHGAIYDVQPDGELSMSARIKGVPEVRLRRMGRPVLVKGAV
jgi:hypothetical protein